MVFARGVPVCQCTIKHNGQRAATGKASGRQALSRLRWRAAASLKVRLRRLLQKSPPAPKCNRPGVSRWRIHSVSRGTKGTATPESLTSQGLLRFLSGPAQGLLKDSQRHEEREETGNESMKPGIALPISATRHLPAWALGLSLATHLVLLFWPALPQRAARDVLPVPLAVSFRLPPVLASTIAGSASPVLRALPPPPLSEVSPRSSTSSAARSRPVPPVGTTVLAVSAADNAQAGLATTLATSPSPVSERGDPPRAPVADVPPRAVAPDPAAMARYIRLLGDLLAQQQQYPRLAAARGWEGEVRLRLQLARKGTVIAVHIVHSSGFDVLDQHAVQLVHGTLLPPPPAGSSSPDAGPDLTIDVPIHYALKGS